MKTFLRIISYLLLAAAITCVILAFFNGLPYLIFGFGYLFLRWRVNVQIEVMEQEEQPWER